MELAWTEARRTLAAIAESPQSGWVPLTAARSGALNQFAAMYRQHLDGEDSMVYPAAQATLSPAAVQAMSEDMMQRRGVPSRK